MIQIDDKGIWLCSPCLDFSFNTITNARLCSQYKQKRQNTTLELDIRKGSVCSHTLNRSMKGIPCTTCQSLIHRKCS